MMQQLAIICFCCLLRWDAMISCTLGAYASSSGHRNQNKGTPPADHHLRDRNSGKGQSRSRNINYVPSPPPTTAKKPKNSTTAAANAQTPNNSASSSGKSNNNNNNNNVNMAVVQSDAAFSVYYGRNFKVVQNLFYNDSYLLLQEPNVDAGFAHDRALHISVFPDPLSNYALDTSSPVAFLELLGALSGLKGIPASFSSSSACLARMIEQGLLPTLNLTSSLAPPASTSSSTSTGLTSNTSITTPTPLLTVQALISSMNSPDSAASLQAQQRASAELATDPHSNYIINDTLNIISFDAAIDQGPLKRAEWIKFLAAFFNLEARANEVYTQIERNYQCLNGSFINLATSDDNSSSTAPLRPLVAWLAYDFENGAWIVSMDAYKIQLTLDAGGSYVDPSAVSQSYNMSSDADMYNFSSVLSTLHVIVDETPVDPSDLSYYTTDNFTALANITDTSAFPFLANKRLWRHDKRLGFNHSIDWLEGAMAQPQVVLRDLMEALHPSTMGYNTTYFRNVAMGESTLNSSSFIECQHDLSTPLQPTIIPCIPTP